MRRFTFVILLLTFCAPASADETQIQKATNVVNEIMSTPDKGIPRDLLNKAVCVGIIPSELKGAFLIGAPNIRTMPVLMISLINNQLVIQYGAVLSVVRAAKSSGLS